MQLLNEIKTILAPVSLIDLEEIKPELSLEIDLGVDSFGTMEVIIELENRYDIKIEDQQIKQFATVQDVVDYVRGAIEAKECGGNYETI